MLEAFAKNVRAIVRDYRKGTESAEDALEEIIAEVEDRLEEE